MAAFVRPYEMKRNYRGAARRSKEPESTLVSTLLYETIRTYREATNGEAPSSVYLNKIPFLVAKELAEDGISIPLPYAWYLFGPETEEAPNELKYRQAQKSVDPGGEGGSEAEYRTIVEWSGAAPAPYEGDRSVRAIKHKVIELVQNYVGPDRSELLVDRAYELAPFEFQRKFRSVRINLGRTGRGSTFQPAAQSTDLDTLVHDAFNEFPRDRFTQLCSSAVAAQRIVRYAWARIERRDRYAAAEAMDQFWAAFASSLRTLPEGHSEWVSDELIEDWKDLARRDASRCRKALGDIAIRISRADQDVRRDNILGPLLDSRESERAEAVGAIDDALADANELNALLIGQSNGGRGG